ncbi:MAG: epoxyqueuosine reductase QueH [Ruminococcaceae bacterium]|nr:epoxyqueuosine reductase QueH [Oscillospiraceae bacterium]
MEKELFMQIQNYSRWLDNKIAEIKKNGTRPTLLMQACCAPCSSYVLEYLSDYFDMTMFFYNPNISPESEFVCRYGELERFVSSAGYTGVKITAPVYDSREFYDAVRGMEELSEGSERCQICYELRLRKTAEFAKENGFDYFSTTLSISPYKNAKWLNEIGEKLENELGVKYLYSDFKKKNGYKRSIELSNEYGLYRQNYCGCVFSKRDSEKK